MRWTASPDGIVAALAASFLEGGWIVLAYLVVEVAWARTSAPLPGLAFVIAALLGVASVRWAARRRMAGYEPALALVAVGLGLIGCLVPFGTIPDALSGDPLGIARAHPGGLLLGVAFVRGTAHATADDDARIADLALGPGLAAIAVGWMLIALSDLPHHPAATAAAFAGTVGCVAGALTSLGLARLAALRRLGVTGADRRMWVALVGVIVCALVALAIPLALVVGVPIDTAARTVAGPVVSIVTFLALLLVIPAAIVVQAVTALLDLLHGVFGFVPRFHPAPPLPVMTLPWEPSSAAAGLDLSLVLVAILPLAAAAIFVVLVRLVGRRRPLTADPAIVELREIELPSRLIHLHRPRIRRVGHRGEPRSASEAYLSSLEMLAGNEAWERRRDETPAEHARRVGVGPLAPLRRLATDYALAEFGHRPLSAVEQERAIARWRSLRRSVRG